MRKMNSEFSHIVFIGSLRCGEQSRRVLLVTKIKPLVQQQKTKQYFFYTLKKIVGGGRSGQDTPGVQISMVGPSQIRVRPRGHVLLGVESSDPDMKFHTWAQKCIPGFETSYLGSGFTGNGVWSVILGTYKEEL
jgi:hypothetical protein